MATLDYVSAVMDRLWELIEGSAAVTAAVRLTSRVRLDGDKVSPGRPGGKVGVDVPEILIEPLDFSDSFFTADPTFGTNAPGFMAGTCDWTENVTQSYAITVTHRDPRYGRPDLLLDLDVMKALRAAGPRLGLAYVVSWGPARGTRARTRQGTAAGTLRAVTRIVIPVAMQFDGRSLLA